MSDELPHMFLFTGKPGIGKTTLLRTITNQFDSRTVVGFFSSEIRIEGRRQGFQIEIVTTGQKGLLASPDVEGDVRFGTLLPDGRRRLGITLDFLERIACPMLSEISELVKLVVIDEIGPMQAYSQIFRHTLEALLRKRVTVLGSIAESEDPWISSIRNSSGVAVFEVNKSNRDILAMAITAFLSTKL